MEFTSTKKRISQETFDEVVRENMDEFEMEAEEAIADAVTQFEAQGVDLTNIVRDKGRFSGDGGDGASVGEVPVHPVVEACRRLAELAVSEEPDVAGLIEAGNQLQELCKDQSAERVLAGERLAVEALCTAASKLQGAILPAGAAAWTAFHDGDTESVVSARSGLGGERELMVGEDSGLAPVVEKEKEEDEEDEEEENEEKKAAEVSDVVPSAAWVAGEDVEKRRALECMLRTFAVLCLKEDRNRVHAPGHFAGVCAAAVGHESLEVAIAAMEAGTAFGRKREGAKRALKDQRGLHAALRWIKECGEERVEVLLAAYPLIRCVVSNDDPDATVSKAFDTAREIGGNPTNLAVFFRLALVHQDNPTLVGETFALLRALAVNDELCVLFDAANILTELLCPLYTLHRANPAVAKRACLLLRSLANSDRLKRSICETPAISLVLSALDLHARDPAVCDPAAGTVSNVALRIPENAPVLIEAGAAPLLAQTMRLHPTHPGVQRSACLAVRNIISRNKHLWTHFQEEDIEPLIRNARTNHPKSCGDVAYAALRDAGLT